MQIKVLSPKYLFPLFISCFLVILTFSHTAIAAVSTPSLTYSVSVQPNQRGQVEIAVQGYNESSMTFRILSTDTGLNAIGNIGDISAHDSQGLSLLVTTLSEGWTVSNPSKGDFTFKYSFGASLNRQNDYSTFYCYISDSGAFFENSAVLAYPDYAPLGIDVVFFKPSAWTIGTSLTPLANNRYTVPNAPDLKIGLLNESTRMGVAEAVVTQNCGDIPITFIAYQPTSHYENFWYAAYGNNKDQQMREYIDLNCRSINYFMSIFGNWPGGSHYLIATNASGVTENPTHYNRWMQPWPRERYSQVPHHTLHAWIDVGSPNAPLVYGAPEFMWFTEGIPSYYESQLASTITGNDVWRGGLYPNYLIMKRAAKFGLLKKSSVNKYALGGMRAMVSPVM